MKGGACDCIPYFDTKVSCERRLKDFNQLVILMKPYQLDHFNSPLAVALKNPAGSKRQLQTAPLWPLHVPIQSPLVASLSMGILS
jgi:hypothetical protein